jgi:hypothetical protein
MALLIEIPAALYGFWICCDASSREYAILKNGVVVCPPNGDGRVIQIPCELSDAESLLAVATKFCPEAVPAIKGDCRTSVKLLPQQFRAKVQGGGLVSEHVHYLVCAGGTLRNTPVLDLPFVRIFLAEFRFTWR